MPEGWAWCRLGEAGIITDTGYPFDASLFTNDSKNRKQIIRIRDILRGYSETYSDENCPDSYIVNEGDILIGMDGDFNIAKWKTDGALLNQRVCRINKNNELINLDYVFYLLPIPLLEINKNTSSVTVKHLSNKQIENLIFPIPPFNEQNRIVNHLENIFSQIRMLEQNKSVLQTAIKQAKSKILDLAIHGKLVPQDPNDEPAKELLKRIVTSDNRPYKKFEDEVPFDLPDTWEWCNLDDIYNHTTGKALKKSNSTGTLHKYITTSNLYWNSFDFTEVRSMYFTDEELEKCTIKKGDLILCNGGDVGRAAIWNYDYDICYQNHVSRLRPKSVDINNYFYLYLLMLYKESGLLAGKGIGITSLSASDLLTTTLPLPPLAEQQRIVTKIEELFAQLDSISEQLA